MGDQLQALDQARTTAIDLAILEAFRRNLATPVPQWEARMLPAHN